MEPQYRHKKFDIQKNVSPESLSLVISNSDNVKDNESIQDGLENLHNSKKQSHEFKDSTQISLEIYATIKEKQSCSLSDEDILEIANIQPTIRDEHLLKICEYHANMARTFSKKQRSAKDQERRDKNTEACRISRKMTKLRDFITVEKYKTSYEENLRICEELTRTKMYLNTLVLLENTDAQLFGTIPDVFLDFGFRVKTSSFFSGENIQTEPNYANNLVGNVLK
uniref:BZIP domain-containing protein n=1 Tax=Glossina brevipalpis TaxID=37001 RepID=A0A1A9WUP4_9MUSC